jgi:hypothetical protein
VNYYFFALLFAVCLYAVAFGGGPERVGATAYALACVASHLVYSAPPIKFRSVEIGVFIVDVLIFVVFVVLTVRANRFWPIWVSALLGLGVLGHLARWAGPDTIPWAYQLVLSIWSYPILATVAIGTFNHRRRVARFGTDRSWSSFSVPSGPMPPPGPRT